MRLFLKVAERRTGGNSYSNIYQEKGKILSFSYLPNKAFYCLNGIHVPVTVSKVIQGQYFAIQG